MSVDAFTKVGIFALGLQLLGCTQSEVSFSSDVQPIFEQHCIECHDGAGEGVAASGFSVRNYDSIMKGTNLGKVVIPGSSMSSTLFLVIAQKTAPEIQMPPHHAKAWADGRGSPLSDGEVGIIQDWIDQGARNN
ncbi:MAG: c-type cytochrome domain-containing protein [Woeseia sp.]